MTALILALGLLLAAWAPKRRRSTRPGGPAPPGTALLRRAVAAVGRAVLGGVMRVRRRSRPPDVGAVISEVATRLRSGAPVEHAWSAAVERALGPSPPPGWLDAGPGGRSSAGGGLGAGGERSEPLPAGLSRLTQACRGHPPAEVAVRAVTAATRLSRTTGAPLADVLDRCVQTVVEAERARDARDVALAGPRSTARILTGLPLLGLVLGAGLGADPVATALDGGWGTASVGCGVALLYAGARWSAALVRAAA